MKHSLPTSQPTGTPGRRVDPRVWVVDESAAGAAFVRESLGSRWDVAVYADAPAALAALAAMDPPDVLVLWGTPAAGPSLDALRAVRALHDAEALPVLMRTAPGATADVVAALEAGANDHLATPCEPAELRARVGTLARVRHLRRALERVEAERERLESVVDRLPANITLHRGPDHVFTLSNAAHQATIGGRGVLGRPLREALPELAGQGLAERLDGVYRTGEAFVAREAPATVAGGDGVPSRRFYNLAWQPVRAPDGTVDGVATFSVDVTQLVEARHHAEALTERVRRSEELFRISQEASPNGFSYHRIVRGADGAVDDLEYVYQNAAAARINHLPAGRDVEGVRMLAAFPALRDAPLWASYRRVAETGEPWRGEVHYDGEHFDAWFRITGVRPTPESVAFTFEDVTAAKRAESERAGLLAQIEAARADADAQRGLLHALLMQAPVAVCVMTGPTLVFTLANARYEQMVGRTGLVGKTYRGAFPELPDDAPPFRMAAGVYASGEAFTSDEYRVPLDRRGDGTLEDVYFLFTCQPVRDGGGAVGGVMVVAVDVTEQVWARQQVEALAGTLQIEQARLRAVLDHVPAGIVFAEAPSGRILFGNHQAERILGHPVLSTHDAEGRDAWGAFHPDGRRVARDAWTLDRVLRGETVPSEEFLYQRGDGTRAWIRAGGAPIRDANGAVTGGVAAFYDVDREKRLELELRASEEQFRTFADTMPLLAWYAEPDGHIPWYNRRWYEYTGTTPAEQEGWQWQSVHDPADLPRVVARWRASIESGEPFEDQFRLRRHDGAFRWFLTRVVPLRDAAGRVVRWFGTNVDVDDRERAERALKVLADAGARLAATLDVEATLREVSRFAVPDLADWCGVYLRDEGEPLRPAVLDHVDPLKAAALREVFARYRLPDDAPHGYARVVRTGASEVLAVDERLLDAAATDSYHRELLRQIGAVSVMTVPLAVAGRVIGALSLGSSDPGRRFVDEDLPVAEELGRRVAAALDRARLFDAAQRERVRAEEANRAKDEFLATVSHELRTPINAVLGWVRMLRTDTLPPDKRERALETIDRNVRVQVTLIEELLDFARIISGKLRIDVAPVDLAQIVEAALETLRPAADAKGVRLQSVVAPSTGPLMGDAARLHQVVWNLLSNSVKFTPRGGRVYVRVSREDSFVEVAVADTGEGIREAFLPYVFDRFRQQDATITRRHGGLGLGLAIVKHLVELHGGTIRAESAGPGLGATFTVRLPIAPLLAAPKTRASDPALLLLPGVPLECPEGIAGLRVLVVDDEEDARELLRSVLEHCGARVRVAASAAQAMEALRAEAPDVLVSDVGMPDADGYELIGRVRALPAEQGGRVPAIALTGYARAEDRMRALVMGFNSHVTKPLEPQELLVTIANLAGRSIRRG